MLGTVGDHPSAALGNRQAVVAVAVLLLLVLNGDGDRSGIVRCSPLDAGPCIQVHVDVVVSRKSSELLALPKRNDDWLWSSVGLLWPLAWGFPSKGGLVCLLGRVRLSPLGSRRWLREGERGRKNSGRQI